MVNSKIVRFRVDDSCEMLEVLINGKHWRSGNFWDFDFVSDAQELLDKLGVMVEVENYSYDNDEEE
jgi:hypothetical protein